MGVICHREAHVYSAEGGFVWLTYCLHETHDNARGWRLEVGPTVRYLPAEAVGPDTVGSLLANARRYI